MSKNYIEKLPQILRRLENLTRSTDSKISEEAQRVRDKVLELASDDSNEGFSDDLFTNLTTLDPELDRLMKDMIQSLEASTYSLLEDIAITAGIGKYASLDAILGVLKYDQNKDFRNSALGNLRHRFVFDGENSQEALDLLRELEDQEEADLSEQIRRCLEDISFLSELYPLWESQDWESLITVAIESSRSLNLRSLALEYICEGLKRENAALFTIENLREQLLFLGSDIPEDSRYWIEKSLRILDKKRNN